MTYADVLEYYGTGMAAADALGYTHQAIYRWRAHGIPARAQRSIEMITRGKLKADKAKRA